MSNRTRPEEIEEFKPISAKDKLLKASKDNPAMPFGLGLGATVFGYMMYSMKNSKDKLSVHLIHTRLGVQGSIVGVLTGVLAYQTYKYVFY